MIRFGGDPALFTVARGKLKEYREKRIQKKIFARILMPRSELAKQEVEEAAFKMREVRMLDKKLYDPKINASVWGETTAITVWDKGLHSVIIRNKAIAGFMRDLFEIAWNGAKSK